MENILRDWENCNKIKIFEIPVTARRTRENIYITFGIEIVDNKFVASHEPLNSEQVRSEYIPCVTREIDPFFSLDENLQALYEDCLSAAFNSEFFADREV